MKTTRCDRCMREAVRLVVVLHVPPILHERLGIDKIERREITLCAQCAEKAGAFKSSGAATLREDGRWER